MDISINLIRYQHPSVTLGSFVRLPWSSLMWCVLDVTPVVVSAIGIALDGNLREVDIVDAGGVDIDLAEASHEDVGAALLAKVVGALFGVELVLAADFID